MHAQPAWQGSGSKIREQKISMNFGIKKIPRSNDAKRQIELNECEEHISLMPASVTIKSQDGHPKQTAQIIKIANQATQGLAVHVPCLVVRR